jgi:hypothetical protein
LLRRVNNARSTGNLSRLVSQPIYRIPFITGSLADLPCSRIMIVSVGETWQDSASDRCVPPNGEEIVRLIAFDSYSIM